MPVLYRKYRSQRFAEVVGQEPIVRTLQNAVKSGSMAHAYLFTGSRGVGKTSVARILAKAVNCLNPQDGDADNKCEICLAIADNNFLDLLEIDAASNTGVENVRELIEHVKFQPSRGKYKVFIIDEVHMLSKAAFNALLKTLEEPPGHAIFVLATTDVQKVPETIISRTQRFDFHKIPEAQILAHLQFIAQQEKLGFGEDVLQLLTTSAQGSLRDALSLLDKVAALGPQVSLGEAQSLLGVTNIKLSEQLLELIAGKDAAALPGLFDQLLAQGTDFSALNRNLLEYLRKLLVYKVAGDKAELDLLPEDKQSLQNLSAKFSLPDIMHLIRLFLRSYKELSATPSPELPLLLSAIEASVKGGGQTTEPAVPVAEQSDSKPKPTGAGAIKPSPASAPSLVVNAVLAHPPAALTDTKEASAVPVTSEGVRAFWPLVIDKIKAANSPLATLLKNSPVQEAGAGTITIAVKYLFHKEHLESKKNYSLITSIITEVSGKNLRLAVKIAKAGDQSLLVDSLEAVGSALKVFGGELVE